MKAQREVNAMIVRHREGSLNLPAPKMGAGEGGG